MLDRASLASSKMLRESYASRIDVLKLSSALDEAGRETDRSFKAWCKELSVISENVGDNSVS